MQQAVPTQIDPSYIVCVRLLWISVKITPFRPGLFLSAQTIVFHMGNLTQDQGWSWIPWKTNSRDLMFKTSGSFFRHRCWSGTKYKFARLSYLLHLCHFGKARKVPAEVPKDSRVFRVRRVLRVRRLWFPTPNCFETWLIPSRTTRSTQCYESAMVWRNLSLYHPFKCLFPLCHALFVWKTRQSTRICGSGTSCVRPWSTRHIVWTGLFRRGWAKFRGNQRSGTINSALLTPGYLLALLRYFSGPYTNYFAEAGTKMRMICFL